MGNIKNYILPISLILILSFSRIIPHPWNFTPVLAAGIFSGFYFKQFFLSFFIVVASMFLGDLYLGFHDTMFFTYISMIVAVGLGLYIKHLKFTEILFSGIISSVCFFMITNFGAWLQSYIMAIPFFHNTLISTFLYLIIFKLFFDFLIRRKKLKTSF